jgi:hypothetical protein
MKLSFNMKMSLFFSLVTIIFYYFMYEAFNLFYYIFPEQISEKTLVVFYYLINFIFLILLTYILIMIIKNNFTQSQTLKECFKKAGIFTLITFLTILAIYFVLINMIMGTNMGHGGLLYLFVLGFFVFNGAYYATIYAYKKVMGR